MDHLSRHHQRPLRYRQTDLLGWFQIDDELKLHRLLDGKVGGRSAFQNFVPILSSAAKRLGNARAVAH